MKNNDLFESEIKTKEESSKTKCINCQICKINEFKYRCPRCQIRTCCLICVKEHKKIYKCSGVRDKFTKKSVKDFNENDFIRDMNFLNATINETNKIGKLIFNLTEENKTEIISISNNINLKTEEENIKKNLDNFFEPKQEFENKKNIIKDSKRQKNFKKLCKKFRSVLLECAPKLIKKYTENKSYCDSKQKKFFWTIKFNFYNFVDNLSKISIENPTIKHLIKRNIKKIMILENLEKNTYLFEDPVDDSIHNISSLHKHILNNKNILGFSLLLKFKEKFENLQNLIILKRINFEDNSGEKNQKYIIQTDENQIYKINDGYYETVDKYVLIKDLIYGNVIHEYPEFEIINTDDLEKII